MIVNPNISEELNLINEINHANRTNHTVDTLIIGQPEVITSVDPGTINGKNTRVTVTANEESDKEGSRVILYRRIHLPTQWRILHSTGFDLHITDVVNEETIKTELRSWFDYREDSVKLTIIKDVNSGIYDVSLKAKDNSLIYIGELKLRAYATPNAPEEPITPPPVTPPDNQPENPPVNPPVTPPDDNDNHDDNNGDNNDVTPPNPPDVPTEPITPPEPTPEPNPTPIEPPVNNEETENVINIIERARKYGFKVR
jgi:hypothetical protein